MNVSEIAPNQKRLAWECRQTFTSCHTLSGRAVLLRVEQMDHGWRWTTYEQIYEDRGLTNIPMSEGKIEVGETFNSITLDLAKQAAFESAKVWAVRV